MLIKCKGTSVSLEENEEIHAAFSNVEVVKISEFSRVDNRYVVFETSGSQTIKIPLSRVNYVMSDDIE